MILPASKARKRYETLKAERQPYLDRARECAKLTIPSLFPEEASTGNNSFPTPYQSIGSRGVNNLASRLLMSQLPSNAPFFRLKLSDFDYRVLGSEEERGKMDAALAIVERTALDEIENQALRVPTFEGLRHLLVAGNSLLVYLPEGGARVFRLDRYVVKRDPMGNMLEAITHESVAPAALKKDLLDAIQESNTQTGEDADDLSNQKTLDLYTHMRRNGNGWESYQEIRGRVVPGSRRTYPLDKCPWLPLRFTRVDGESYGRGLVEEYFGDLRSLETLTKAIVQGSAAAAKILLLVRPNGATKIREVREAPNGGVISGDANDVTVLQLNKYADFRVAKDLMAELEQRLAAAFLMNSSIQRDGERVTAEEIRFMAQELEGALGGLYSILALELQLPLVRLILANLERRKKIPALPSDKVKPQITTGIEALGRGMELNRLAQFLKFLEPFGPEVLARELNLADYIARVGANLGIDTAGLIKTHEQKAQEAQAAQQAQMQAGVMDVAGKAAPHIVKGMMNGEGQQ